MAAARCASGLAPAGMRPMEPAEFGGGHQLVVSQFAHGLQDRGHGLCGLRVRPGHR